MSISKIINEVFSSESAELLVNVTVFCTLVGFPIVMLFLAFEVGSNLQNPNNMGTGGVCDQDIDGDNMPNNSDNCPSIFNLDQMDWDHDGRGNACDVCPEDAYDDFDRDGFCENNDNCIFFYNPGQEDYDNDGTGDTCDPPVWEGEIPAYDK